MSWVCDGVYWSGTFGWVGSGLGMDVVVRWLGVFGLLVDLGWAGFVCYGCFWVGCHV